MKICCNKSNPPLGGLLAVEFYRSSTKDISIIWDCESYVTLPNSTKNLPYVSSNDLIRILENTYNTSLEPLQRINMNHWLSFSLTLEDDIPKSIQYLDKILGPITYLLGESLSTSDLAVYSVLYMSAKYKDISKKNPSKNIQRWMKLIQSQPCVIKALKEIPTEVLVSINRTSARKLPIGNENGPGRLQEGKFIELPHAELGKVVVRFPPEASGYLHIGHAKAALLNQYYQEAFQGKLIMRFDDTNPAKENAEFEKVILEDVAMLEIKPDMFTHTSQYFDLMLEMCEKLMKEGKAFVDDTPAEQMKNEREQKIESKNRNNSVEKNLQLWEEMKKASDVGIQCCVRAKIDMQSPNGCLRDPTIYRCKPEIHPRTGTQYKVYPTYDFACPIVDSIEGVTHVLRTMEYHDRDPQFYWFIEALGIRKPYIWEYSRLSMTNTVLSKRKLTWFVEEGLVDGWDDPRMPTVRGVLRRGMTVEGLRQFIQAQGSSRSVVFMEWDKIWAINKKVIDPIAPRYTTLETNPVLVTLNNTRCSTITVPLHPKNPDVGSKQVSVGPSLHIDQVDAKTLKEGENATFINYGNILINKIHWNDDGSVKSVDATPNLDNKDYKKTVKVTWLTAPERTSNVEVYCVYFDHIISKAVLGKDEDFKKYIGHETRWEVPMIGEPALLNVKVGDIIQLQRRGFFRVDHMPTPPSTCTSRRAPLILFHVPDGHTKEMPFQPKPVQATPSKQAAGKQASGSGAPEAANLNEQITKQGDLVRQLKSAKAEKAKVEGAVKTLLELKAKFKEATGQDWKPAAAPAPSSDAPSSTNAHVSAINQDIIQQGDLVRKLKAAKAEKARIEEAVKTLLDLKVKYKEETGQEWKPAPAPAKQSSPAPAPAKQSSPASVPAKQLSLVPDFPKQSSSGPAPVKQSSPAPKQPTKQSDESQLETLLKQIVVQGDKVRRVKAEKAEKSVIDVEVKNLLNLKAQYKAIAGTDWTPNAAPPKPEASQAANMNGDDDKASALGAVITKQGDLVRELKSKKADKAKVDAEVKKLLELKAQYRCETGTDFAPPVTPRDPKTKEKKEKPKEVKKEVKKEKKEPSPKPAKEEPSSGVKKVTRLGLEASKEVDLSEWYTQVITKSEMIDYYDISGCYILRPWSYSIWDRIRTFLSTEFRKLGIKDGYFPIFVSKAALEREKAHIADFAPEVAWVTHSGSTELAEHIAVRPTSETVMYPAYAKWIQSHRDLPFKLNQWNNVVRWEFKQPQPFLRTREFLWQEGHTAYRLKEEAAEEVLQILDLYARVYEELLAIPVVKGRKTEKEKFAGSEYSTTVEGYIPASGRGIQGATSHHLGQNFSKMFEIVYDDPDTQEKNYVYQNSFGLTTRTIGVMVLVHGDDKGLVLPPRVADIQAIVVPCGITASSSAEERKSLIESCKGLVSDLLDAGIRAEGDYRDNYSPGWKFNHWELKGVPIRVELGPKDIARGEVVAVRRLTGDKLTLKRIDTGKELVDLLEKTHHEMFAKAVKERNERTSVVDKWEDFTGALERKHVLMAPFCGKEACEDNIKNDSARTDDDQTTDVKAPAMGAKSLCIPFEPPRALTDSDKCIHPACSNKPKYITLFGRSY